MAKGLGNPAVQIAWLPPSGRKQCTQNISKVHFQISQSIICQNNSFLKYSPIIIPEKLSGWTSSKYSNLDIYSTKYKKEL